MRQITVISVTAVVAAMVTVFSLMLTSFKPVRSGTDVCASVPIDVMKMMRDAKDLPNESYPAH